MVHAVEVILLHDDVIGIHPVHPVGNLLVVLAFAGDGVHQHRAFHVRAAEQADGPHNPGADPIGSPLLVDLEDRLVKHHGGIVEPEVAVEVPAEVLRHGVLHALRQADHLRLLADHVDDEVGGQAVSPVGEPLDEVPITQGSHPDRAALVVDLGIGGQNLELGHHVRQLAQLSGAQLGGGVRVQHGNLVIADLLQLCGEVSALDGEELGIAARPEHHPAGQGPQSQDDDQRRHRQKGDGALLADKVEVAFDTAVGLEAGGEHGADAVHGAEEEDEDVEFLGVKVQGGKLQVEIGQAEHQGHQQVDEGAAEGVAHGPAGFSGLSGAGIGVGPLKALGVEAPAEGVGTAELECKGHGSCPPFFFSFHSILQEKCEQIK